MDYRCLATQRSDERVRVHEPALSVSYQGDSAEPAFRPQRADSCRRAPTHRWSGFGLDATIATANRINCTKHCFGCGVGDKQTESTPASQIRRARPVAVQFPRVAWRAGKAVTTSSPETGAPTVPCVRRPPEDPDR